MPTCRQVPGGDWVDAVPLSGARVALVAGRAPGQGLQTAAAAGRLRAAVHTLSDMDLQPDELLARLDDLARRLSKEDRHHTPPPVPDSEAREAGATCLYLIYDPVSLRCSMASAGHPWPVIVHPDGTAVSLDHPSAPPCAAPTGRSKRSTSTSPNTRCSPCTPRACSRNSPKPWPAST